MKKDDAADKMDNSLISGDHQPVKMWILTRQQNILIYNTDKCKVKIYFLKQKQFSEKSNW